MNRQLENKNKEITTKISSPSTNSSASLLDVCLTFLIFKAKDNLLQEMSVLQSNQRKLAHLIIIKTEELKVFTEEGNTRIIELQKRKLKALSTKAEEQKQMLLFLQEKEMKRQKAAEQLLKRKEKLKQQKKKAVRDAATLPEFEESIEIIKNKKYRCSFVRSREKVCLLVLFLTGIRVANLAEITASNLKCLLSDENQVYFQVNAIKSRKRVVFTTLLTSFSLQIAKKYKEDIVVLLKDKEPTDYVFTPKNSSFPLERAALTKQLNKHLKLAGKKFGKNITSHSFRIGQVTALIDHFGLLHAQKLIGHQNTETTLRYARNKLDTPDFFQKMHKVEKQKYKKIPRHKLSNYMSKQVNETTKI